LPYVGKSLIAFPTLSNSRRALNVLEGFIMKKSKYYKYNAIKIEIRKNNRLFLTAYYDDSKAKIETKSLTKAIVPKIFNNIYTDKHNRSCISCYGEIYLFNGPHKEGIDRDGIKQLLSGFIDGLFLEKTIKKEDLIKRNEAVIYVDAGYTASGVRKKGYILLLNGCENLFFKDEYRGTDAIPKMYRSLYKGCKINITNKQYRDYLKNDWLKY
jgi:hypothetical protein